jgi:hypothetical protein
MYSGALNQQEVLEGHGMGMAVRKRPNIGAVPGESGSIFAAVTGIKNISAGGAGASAGVRRSFASTVGGKRKFSSAASSSGAMTVASQQFVFMGADEGSQSHGVFGATERDSNSKSGHGFSLGGVGGNSNMLPPSGLQRSRSISNTVKFSDADGIAKETSLFSKLAARPPLKRTHSSR